MASGELEDPRQAPGWSEEDSERFLALGRCFVPEREEQVATLAELVPGLPGAGHVVDLCCGEGLVSEAVLAHRPAVTVHGWDGSEAMLVRVAARLAGYGGRFVPRRFDLAAADWRSALPTPLHAVVSSLAVHHLDGAGKRRLFADLARALAPGGALLLADLVQPASPGAVALAASRWDAAVRRRSLELAGDLSAFEEFRRLEWNLWALAEPDPVDHPSPLFDQLRWLAEAGLVGVDVFWMQAGHAVYGGFRPAG